jgi:eukaryotic-like serine/threonine-protein kinase
MKFTFPPESRPLEGYTIKRAIHRGGFGEVYYALSDAGKEVALKLLQRHNMDVELRGVSQCLNLKHPNLVTIFDVRTDRDGDHWVVMEYVSGKSLDRVIDDYPHGLPMEQVRHWLSGIVAGVEYLHDCGLVHRDLKPANIYTEHGSVKIGDVGLSKFIAPSQRSAQTQSVGTVYYMAPEVAHGRYGKEVDIYALAVILYEMLTGRVPFAGETTGEILMKHLSEEPDLTPIPVPLRPVLARALHKDPQLRTASAADLEREFRNAVVGGGTSEEIPAGAFLPSPEEIPANAFLPPPRSPHPSPPANRPNRPLEQTVEYRPNAVGKPPCGARKPHQAVKVKKASKRRGKSCGSSDPWAWLRIALIAVVVLAIFAPQFLGSIVKAFGGLFVIGTYVALGYGLYRLYTAGGLVGLMSNGAQQATASPVQQPPPSPSPTCSPSPPRTADERKKPVPLHKAVKAHRQHTQPALNPRSLRKIDFRHRLTDLTGALTAAVVCTAVITGGLALVTSRLFAESPSAAQPDPVNVALFGLTTLFGACAILIPSKLWEGTAVSSNVRRLSLMGAGALVGIAAYGLNQFLMVDLPSNYIERPYGIFQHVGSHALLSEALQPTLAGYMVFFGALFALRRWWHQADSFRKKRFRISSLLLTVLLAYVLSAVWAFPQVWGMVWAAGISSVVQLSAAWIPAEQRAALMEGQRHA